MTSWVIDGLTHSPSFGIGIYMYLASSYGSWYEESSKLWRHISPSSKLTLSDFSRLMDLIGVTHAHS